MKPLVLSLALTLLPAQTLGARARAARGQARVGRVERREASLARVERRADEILRANSNRGLTPRAVADYLGSLDKSQDPQDRLAAKALARLILDPKLARALAEKKPELAQSPLVELGGVLLPDSRSEGTAKEARVKVAQLAEQAQKDPAVTALFDGTAAPARP